MIGCMHIPSWPQAGEREAELLRTVLESGQWGGFHPFVTEFERSFAAYQQSAYGISTFNGTVSLELALAVLGIGPGDQVILPAISFISSATAISRVGATPVFVDIEPGSFNIDPVQVLRAIAAQTKAVMAVHFGGAMCQIQELLAICRERNLILLEDAAHAQGSEWNGKRAGSFGLAGSFSFQNGKVLTAGEGGMLVTSDESFAEGCVSLANCGRIAGRSFYEHHRLGTNLRITAFQAAVLIAQFERLPEQIERRSANARLLKNLLEDLPEIVWQEQPLDVTQNSWYLMLGRVPKLNGDEFRRQLSAAGVPCAYYPHTLYQNPLYQRGGTRVLPCPAAEASIREAFWLPHRVLLADEESIREVARAMRAAVGRLL
jgi:dTDP-4-amino-4,6-dideoxygalactose transaminase